MPNLLVDDIPLVDARKTTSDTTTRNILYDACMKGAVLTLYCGQLVGQLKRGQVLLAK